VSNPVAIPIYLLMKKAVTAAAVCGHSIVLIIETSGRCEMLFMPTILIMVTCIDDILPVRVLNSLNAEA
jgi:hypothetical protein